MEFDWTQGPLAEGLLLYQSQHFFAAHESWESLWLAAQPPEKMFLQALIQITAAYHHLQRGNALGTTLLLQAALAKLEGYPDRFACLSVDTLCDDLRIWVSALESGNLQPDLAFVHILPIETRSADA